MEMSVREARAHFRAVLASAERGEPVIITRNGKAIAQISPPPVVENTEESAEQFWERLDHIRKKLGLDNFPPDPRTDEQQIADHRAWRRKTLGPEYFDDESTSDDR
ncbi:MAG: type II toxin-antitoxin system prevent-host-death family antitoxin [Pseudomonadota bacterium]